MSRLRIALPILLSSISIPTFAHSAAYCTYSNWHTPQCESQRADAFSRARNAEIEASLARVKAERDRAFTVARNLEINASVARVEAVRARELAMSLTHCKTPGSSTPRCEAERARQLAMNDAVEESPAEFARARNAEINASVARVEAERKRAFIAARNAEINQSIAHVEERRADELAMSLTHCKTPDSTTPRCEAERAREFADARNAEITASISRVKSARDFVAERNAEIEASLARVQAERERRLSLNLTHCKTPDSTTPRCEAERARNFAAARNAEIEASIAMVEAMRAVRKARDAQIASSLAAAKAERARKFQIARNAEIEASVARVDAARARGEIVAVSDLEPIETGAINFDDLPTRVVAKPVLRSTSVMRPCRAAHYLASPLHFSTASANLDDDMKTRLDQLAVVAKACPRISIEVHGHSDGSGPVQINRSMAERRANAAIDYLVAAGVERKRLTAIGHGAMDPMMPNTNAASRAINRRVEIDIKDPVSEVAQKIMGDLAELLDPTYKPQLARLTP